jgi:hypothetical protein
MVRYRFTFVNKWSHVLIKGEEKKTNEFQGY